MREGEGEERDCKRGKDERMKGEYKERRREGSRRLEKGRMGRRGEVGE
jgi:hypothetical protein